MFIEVTAEMAYKRLRSDIAHHLGYDGVNAILDYYDSNNTEGETIIFDDHLFSIFEKYDDLEHVMKVKFPVYHKMIIDKHVEDNGDIKWLEVHETFLDYLRTAGYTVLFMDRDEDIFGEIVIAKM